MKAEGISDLISSETEIQRQQAIRIMEGKSSKIFETLRQILIKVLSKIEAKIDFPDEDLPKDILKNIEGAVTDPFVELHYATFFSVISSRTTSRIVSLKTL